MKTVLIIDGDLGFVFWLCRLLADAGCRALPAKGFSEANALLGELHADVDLLVVDSSLAGATDFVQALQRSRPTAKIVAALDRNESASQLQIADIVARKPLQFDGAAGTMWVGMVKQALNVLAHRSGGV